MKKILTVILAVSALLAGCSKKANEKVVIYSNADDEAITAIKTALDTNGYEGKYVFQEYGTSELGAKLFAEGKDIEADLITMSSFYIESAQAETKMFKPLDFTENCVISTPDYYLPMLAIQGAVIYNTKMFQEKNLTVPASIKDIGKDEYNGLVSVVDPKGSTTAWLMVQALIDAYGEDGAKEALKEIYKNAGPHLELSGSGPIKKIRSGEVAVGFGLRHQAVRDMKKGLPVSFVDPEEGNFNLTESVAVIEKGDATNPDAMKMAKIIIENARKDIIKDYPVVLYDGESVAEENIAKNPKTFKEPLTTDLLKKHQELSESCK